MTLILENYFDRTQLMGTEFIRLTERIHSWVNDIEKDESQTDIDALSIKKDINYLDIEMFRIYELLHPFSCQAKEFYISWAEEYLPRKEDFLKRLNKQSNLFDDNNRVLSLITLEKKVFEDVRDRISDNRDRSFSEQKLSDIKDLLIIIINIEWSQLGILFQDLITLILAYSSDESRCLALIPDGSGYYNKNVNEELPYIR